MVLGKFARRLRGSVEARGCTIGEMLDDLYEVATIRSTSTFSALAIGCILRTSGRLGWLAAWGSCIQSIAQSSAEHGTFHYRFPVLLYLVLQFQGNWHHVLPDTGSQNVHGSKTYESK